MEGLDETTILSLIAPGELHLLLGITTRLFSCLQKVWPGEEGADMWFAKTCISKKHYQDEKFMGNDCNKLLHNVACLEEMISYAGTWDIVEKFALTMRHLDRVKSSCFGNVLKDDYEAEINAFYTRWLKLDITTFFKVHVLVFHVTQFCEMTGLPMGPFSEQTGESIHHKFDEHWARFKLDPSHREYAKWLLRAVVDFNSKHI